MQEKKTMFATPLQHQDTDIYLKKSKFISPIKELSIIQSQKRLETIKLQLSPEYSNIKYRSFNPTPEKIKQFTEEVKNIERERSEEKLKQIRQEVELEQIKRDGVIVRLQFSASKKTDCRVQQFHASRIDEDLASSRYRKEKQSHPLDKFYTKNDEHYSDTVYTKNDEHYTDKFYTKNDDRYTDKLYTTNDDCYTDKVQTKTDEFHSDKVHQKFEQRYTDKVRIKYDERYSDKKIDERQSDKAYRKSDERYQDKVNTKYNEVYSDAKCDERYSNKGYSKIDQFSANVLAKKIESQLDKFQTKNNENHFYSQKLEYQFDKVYTVNGENNYDKMYNENYKEKVQTQNEEIELNKLSKVDNEVKKYPTKFSYLKNNPKSEFKSDFSKTELKEKKEFAIRIKQENSQFVEYLLELIKIVQKIEKQKEQLILKDDFSLEYAFKFFDLKKQGVISKLDLEFAFSEYGIYPKKECLLNFFERYFDNKNQLDQESFGQILLPLDKECLNILSRKKMQRQLDIQTMHQITAIFIYLLQIEEKIIQINNILKNSRDLDESDIYSIVEKYYYGFISFDDLKESINYPITNDDTEKLFYWYQNKKRKIKYFEFKFQQF